MKLLKMAKAVSDCGALNVSHLVVRLNGAVGEISTDWIHETMPDRATKVLNLIQSYHGNALKESLFGIHMRGEGPIADELKSVMRIARAHYYKNKVVPSLNTKLFDPFSSRQYRLF